MSILSSIGKSKAIAREMAGGFKEGWDEGVQVVARKSGGRLAGDKLRNTIIAGGAISLPFAFGSGVESSMGDSSRQFVDSLVGAENSAQYMLSTDFGLRSALTPLPLERFGQRWSGLRRGMHHQRAAGLRDQQNAYANRMPSVNGSTVFDRWNHRGSW